VAWSGPMGEVSRRLQGRAGRRERHAVGWPCAGRFALLGIAFSSHGKRLVLAVSGARPPTPSNIALHDLVEALALGRGFAKPMSTSSSTLATLCHRHEPRHAAIR